MVWDSSRVKLESCLHVQGQTNHNNCEHIRQNWRMKDIIMQASFKPHIYYSYTAKYRQSECRHGWNGMQILHDSHNMPRYSAWPLIEYLYSTYRVFHSCKLMSDKCVDNSLGVNFVIIKIWSSGKWRYYLESKCTIICLCGTFIALYIIMYEMDDALCKHIIPGEMSSDQIWVTIWTWMKTYIERISCCPGWYQVSYV